MTVNRIRMEIDKTGKTTKQVAQDIEIPYTTLANYYQGKRLPRSKETWQKLAEYFDVTVPYLTGWIDEDEEIANQLEQERIVNKRKTVVDYTSYEEFEKHNALKISEFGEEKWTDNQIEVLMIRLGDMYKQLLDHESPVVKHFDELIRLTIKMAEETEPATVIQGSNEYELHLEPRSLEEQQENFYKYLAKYNETAFKFLKDLPSD